MRLVSGNILLKYSCTIHAAFLCTFMKNEKKCDHARIRTWNLLIRSQAPCPLGHATNYSFTYQYVQDNIYYWTCSISRSGRAGLKVRGLFDPRFMQSSSSRD